MHLIAVLGLALIAAGGLALIAVIGLAPALAGWETVGTGCRRL
jgi:hypothetical protein